MANHVKVLELDKTEYEFGLNNPLTIKYRDKQNTLVEFDYSGEVAVEGIPSEENPNGNNANTIDLSGGVYYATTSTTATRVSNKLFITDKAGEKKEYNGANIVEIDSIASAGDADKLGGLPPSSYATDSELNTLSKNVSNLTTSYNNHIHTFTGDSNITSDNLLTISYNSGKLNINTLHNHTVTPTGEISKTSINQTSNIEVEVNETSINILSNVDITEDSITITGDNITIENNENNYNLIIE